METKKIQAIESTGRAWKTALFVMHILSGMKKLSPLVRVVIHHKSSYNICVAFESKEEVQQDF